MEVRILVFVVWWIIGTSSWLWLIRSWDITWGQLFWPIAFGFVGPIIWFVIALKVLVEGAWWSTPIFPKKKQNG